MSPQPTIALSIRQPWAWLILHAGKDVENRTWQTSFRGRFLIHASGTMRLREYQEAVEFARAINPALQVPPPLELPVGGIVGSVDLVACVQESASPWFMPHPYLPSRAFVLRDPIVMPFLRSHGRLGFYQHRG